MAKIIDRVNETTTTTGTGTIDLNGAEDGYRSFSEASSAGELSSGGAVFYIIEDNPQAPTAWEYGLGTWTSGTPNTLSRDTVYDSSNAGSKINLQSGTTYTVRSTPVARAFANITEASNIFKAGSGSGATAVAGIDNIIIDDDSNAGLSILTPNTASGFVAFGDPQNANIGRLQYDHSTNTFYIRVNNVDRITTASDGGVTVNGDSEGSVRLSGGSTVRGRIHADSSGSLLLNADPDNGAASSVITMRVDGAEVGRFSSGIWMVGKTTSGPGTNGVELNPNGSSAMTASGSGPLILNRETNDGTLVSCRRSNASVGSIAVTTTATAFNTSSDGRLKDRISPLSGATAIVADARAVEFTWKDSGQRGIGFVAQEFLEIAPHAVSLIDGYYQMDYSKLVPILWQAVKELAARVQTLEQQRPATPTP